MKDRTNLNKFSAWIQRELHAGRCTIHEAEAMQRDFAAMSEKRLKKLLENFNL